jgi:hypothetical protein
MFRMRQCLNCWVNNLWGSKLKEKCKGVKFNEVHSVSLDDIRGIIADDRKRVMKRE